MDKAAIKQKVCEAIAAHRADIEAISEAILAEPELGFKEVKTSRKVQEALERLGIEFTAGHGITGVKARMKGRNSKRTVAMLAELDAIVHEHIPRALAQKMAATNAEIIGLDAIKLIESGLGAICDATVAVTAPEEVRVKRIMARDSITEEYARSRIAAQKDADYFRAQCDYEFVNDLPTAEKAEHAAEVYINTIINNLKEETER